MTIALYLFYEQAVDRVWHIWLIGRANVAEVAIMLSTFVDFVTISQLVTAIWDWVKILENKDRWSVKAI